MRKKNLVMLCAFTFFLQTFLQVAFVVLEPNSKTSDRSFLVKDTDRGAVTWHLAPTDSLSVRGTNNSTAVTAARVMCRDVIRLSAACGGWCSTMAPFGILRAPPNANL